MGLFSSLFGSGSTDDLYGSPGGAQASADYQATAGGWHEPAPPTIGRDFDPAHDDDFTGGGWQ